MQVVLRAGRREPRPARRRGERRPRLRAQLPAAARARRARDAGPRARARASATRSGRGTRRSRPTRRRAIAQRLEAAELRFDVNAGPTGSLFGSVTATNIADRLWEDQKIRIDRRKLDVEHDQAHRPLHRAGRGLRRRDRRAARSGRRPRAASCRPRRSCEAAEAAEAEAAAGGGDRRRGRPGAEAEAEELAATAEPEAGTAGDEHSPYVEPAAGAPDELPESSRGLM